MDDLSYGSKLGAGEVPIPGDRTTRQLVTFSLGAQQYCVDVTSVREIRASNVITPLPTAPDYLCGVTNLRGTIVPIIDLKVRFGLERTKARGQIVVVVAIAGGLKGLLVDGVSDILTVGSEEIAPIPVTDGNGRNPFFDGLLTRGEEMMIVVALDRVAGSTPPAGDAGADGLPAVAA